MPELPDLIVYIEALRRHVVGRRLDRVVLLSPFVLRSVDPPLESIFGSVVTAIDRIGLAGLTVRATGSDAGGQNRNPVPCTATRSIQTTPDSVGDHSAPS